MKILRPALAFTLAAAACGAWGLASCQPAPTNVPLRTFERAQKMDFVCMHVYDEVQLVQVPPTPAPLSACAPAAPSTDGTTLPFHLYALVTQSVRGEVAVVDLTAQKVVDQNKENPGVNFLPVGQLPMDIASTPDSTMSFVTTADPDKPAIYALPSVRILGDSQTLVDASTPPPNTLPSWPVCGLPQKPGPISVVPRANGGFDLAVVLPGDAAQTAKIVLIDAKVFDTLPPGQLAPCPISAAVDVADTVPPFWSQGPAWSDGVPYATVDSTKDLPRANDSVCENVPLPSADAGPDGEVTFAITPLRGSHAHPSWAVRDGDFLFVADNGLPLIHVFDLSVPNVITELAPYVATSLVNPARVVTISQIAVSPRTRDLKRYMYALDEKQGTVLVYDVTDPRTAIKSPLVRPHPELNPFQPVDRLSFTSPVASLAFARHDFPITEIGSIPLVATRAGLLCNPSGSINTVALTSNDNDNDLGALYRKGESGGGFTSTAGLGLVPGRLRGIFGVLTLANGLVITIDVDDWDSPCRRPINLDGTPPDLSASGLWGQIAQTFKASDPFGAPGGATCTGPSCPIGVTNEGYFPVTAPHRLRSSFLLSNDPATGQNLPTIIGLPQLLLGTQPISVNEAAAKGYASLQAFLAREDPTVNVDQDWTVTYEGALPGFDGLAATLDTEDGWQSLTFSQPAGNFCNRGVQDQTLGRAIVSALETEASAKKNLDSMGKPTFATPPRASDRTADYVQIADDLLPPSDSYWTLEGLDCWTFPDGKGGMTTLASGAPRYNACLTTFGAINSPTLARELPVLESYDDRLVTGRFLYSGATQSSQGRIIAPRDASGETSLKLTQCCFHKEAKFRVRTGNQWLAIGTVSGYLQHLRPVPDTKRCVMACDQRLSLFNGRAIDLIPTSTVAGAQGHACPCNAGLTCANNVCVDRNNPFAIRNPLLALQLVGSQPMAGTFTNNQRDLTYKFPTRGRFQAQAINLAATSTAVSPQSMRYIDSLGQMGIVDGSSLGLVLLDLNTLIISKTYN
jgi:hypothetical protein